MVLSACGNPYYQGPKSDHFDGKEFFAPEKIERKNWLAVARWRATAKREKWPEWVDIKKDTPPARVEGDELRISFVNHATVLLQTKGLNILTDPIWSYRCSPLSFMGPKRVNAPGIGWDDLPKIDLVLISHSHYDHLDLPTIRRLVKRDNPQFIVPLGVDRIIHRNHPAAMITTLDWKEHTVLHGLTIHAEPTQHWSARSFWDANETLWASYIIDTGKKKFYFGGDTGYASGKIFKDIGKTYGKIDFAMLGIGAYEPRWFMKQSHIAPFEAVQIFQDIQATHAMPIHFGTFQLSDEGHDHPTRDLAAALQEAGISDERFKTLQPGQVWVLPENE